MSGYNHDYDRDDERDYDLAELRAHRRAERRILRRACECGDDLPGSCPGPANCPYADHGDEE